MLRVNDISEIQKTDGLINKFTTSSTRTQYLKCISFILLTPS